ncbi:MAG: 16S rRNA (guanine(966)-N(2))-methyltransferase RsmD [Proteobacteria bacterium]|nr:16S rRNA (guanine(966)-N(2))-methyltransferase RsmD [Pseudomonadota bacterium]
MDKLRITGGYLKGRNIAILKNGSARYTSSKVREAIFNLIGDISGCKVLDLFAGSGSFTIEAVSRGAVSATCVERDGDVAAILQKNLSGLSIDKDCLVLNMDVKYAVPFLCKRLYNYDIIFMDPPYKKGLVTETMLLLKNSVVYDNGTIFIVEHSKREGIDLTFWKGLEEITVRQYGNTNISIFKVDDKCS